MINKPRKDKRGFTLVELSIVIVIIGLIIAGVTAGQSLVRQGQLRSVITEINNFKTAINSFKLQYNGLPGDLGNAASYWPSQGVVNGNNDGFMGDVTASATSEPVQAWRMLTKSGLVPGDYTGTVTTTPIGTSCPASSIKGGFYLPWGGSSFINSVHYGYNKAKNVMQFAGNGPTLNNFPGIPILKASEAASIDAKIDDGLPYKGWTTSRDIETQFSNCVASSAYNVSYITAVACGLTFAIN